MSKYLKAALILTALILQGCLPPPVYSIKQDVSGPPISQECARSAASSVPGVQGVVVNENSPKDFQLLVEGPTGIESVHIDGWGNGNRGEISSLGWESNDTPAADTEKRRTFANKIILAIQERCVP